MGIEQNKAIAKEFVEATIKRDIKRVAAVMSDDGTLKVIANPPRFGRVWSKADWCKYLEIPSPFKDGLAVTIHSMTAEGDRVSLESETYGTIAATGKIYNNMYHYLITVRDGKVTSIREYMDTQHLSSVLPPPKM